MIDLKVSNCEEIIQKNDSNTNYARTVFDLSEMLVGTNI